MDLVLHGRNELPMAEVTPEFCVGLYALVPWMLVVGGGGGDELVNFMTCFPSLRKLTEIFLAEFVAKKKAIKHDTH